MTTVHNDCTTTESESNELPEIAENGFIIVSDFFAYQHESIVTAMKNSDIPHQIEFHPHNEKMLWREGAFRVYVAPLHLEAARDLCRATETAPVN
ncbi:hypothetical protein QUB10_07865 [Microcoleus sp. B5-D4]|uniref:hypothetical protein n=1 Tax=unclassified Microcoleus TaxID=2642155 RepID=UPI002FD25970